MQSERHSTPLTASHSSRSSFAGNTTQLRTRETMTLDVGLLSDARLSSTCEDRRRQESPFAQTLRTCSCSKTKKRLCDYTAVLRYCSLQFVHFRPRRNRLLRLEGFGLNKRRRCYDVGVGDWGGGQGEVPYGRTPSAFKDMRAKTKSE